MNPIENALHPLALASAIAHFLQDIHRPRGKGASAASAEDAKELNLMQLYRLTRGRETIAPAVGAMLAKRVNA